MRKNWRWWMVALLFLAIGLYVGIRTKPETEVVSAALFSQSLQDANGNMQNLAKWKGKNLLVNFWAPWCAPCVEEMPELAALQQEFLSKVQIVGIGIDSAPNIAQFSAKYKISFPLYSAGVEGVDLSRRFGNQSGGLPFTVLLGKEGQLKHVWTGRLSIAEVKKALAEL